MRKPSVSRVLPLFTVCLGIACSPAPEDTPVDAGNVRPAPPAGVIVGDAVLVGADGVETPAANLLMVLQPGAREITTAADGTFRIEGLAAGRYLLRAELDLDSDGRIDIGFTRRGLELAGDHGLDLEKVPVGHFGDIAGHVLLDGKPAAGVVVGVTSVGAGSGSERVTATDALGDFRARTLLPGDYVVRALFAGEEPRAAEATAIVPPSGIGWAELSLAALPDAVSTVRGRADGTAGTEFTFELIGAGDDRVVKTVTAAQVFEARVPAGVYVAQVTSSDPSVPPVSIPDLLAFGDVTLDTLAPAPPADAAHRDLDGDGVMADQDPDDDGDGCADALEPASTRLDPASCTDLDGDGVGDGLDPDDDGDGTLDVRDACPARDDPAAATSRPGGCAPYPDLSLLISAPATADVDDPLQIELFPTGGISDVALTLAPKEAGNATVTAGDREGLWRVTFSAAGPQVLVATAKDALHEHREEITIVVDAPPIAIDLPESIATLDGAEVTLNARIFEPLSNISYSWSESETEGAEGLLFTLASSTSARTTATAGAPGRAKLTVRATRGARSGEASTIVTAWGSPIDVVVPAEIEVTAGAPVTVTAALATPLEGAAFAWAALDDRTGLILDHTDMQAVAVDAGATGNWLLGVRVAAPFRSGFAVLHVNAVAPGTITVLGGPPHLSRGEQRTGSLVLDPPLANPVVTWTARGTNPQGGVLTSDGLGFTFLADVLGEWTFDVVAVAGGRAARGSVVIAVDSEPLSLSAVQSPSGRVRAGTPVTIAATATGVPSGVTPVWRWTPRAVNPSTPALTGASTGTLTFTPDAPGTYQFDVSARAGTRGGSRLVEVVADAASEIGVTGSWWNTRVGALMQLQLTTDWDVSSTFTASWKQDPTNSAVLPLQFPWNARAVAVPTTAGHYRVTANIRDGARAGSFLFEFDIVAADQVSPIPLTAYPGQPTYSVGDNTSLYVDSYDWPCNAHIAWTQAEGNPAQIDLSTWVDDWSVRFVPTQPGEYAFTAAVSGDNCADVPLPVSASATARVKIYPPFEINLAVSGDEALKPLRVTASSPESGLSWSWSINAYPLTCYTSRDRPLLESSVGPVASIKDGPRCTGDYTFRVSATRGVRTTVKTAVVTISKTAPPRFVAVPDTSAPTPSYLAAVGVPFKIRVFTSGLSETTFRWTEDPTNKFRVTLSGADTAEATFVARETGDLKFSVDLGYFGRSSTTPDIRTVRVRVVQQLPDAYADGPPGIVLSIVHPLAGGSPTDIRSRPSNLWACRSGRTDVASATWERVGAGNDADATVDGAWLLVSPSSLEHRVTAWKCRITTTSGQTFSAIRPLVVTSHVYSSPWNVVFVKPSNAAVPTCTTRPLPAGCLGTFDDPFPRLSMALSGGDSKTLVLYQGEEALTAPIPARFSAIIGGVDPVTYEQAPARFPSRLVFNDVTATAPLVALNESGFYPYGYYPLADGLDGVEVVARAQAASVAAMTVVESKDGNFGGLNVARSNFDVTANAGQPVIVIRHLGGRTTAPPTTGSFTGNRVFVHGGTGTGAITEGCFGSLVAHNAIRVDAASALSAAVRVDCSSTTTQRLPMQILNNAVWMENGQPGFSISGAPATDVATSTVAGHLFGGNWFSGAGPFVLVQGAAARTLSTPSAINAGFAAGGLEGGGNLNDSGCFDAPLPSNAWLWTARTGSACVGAAVKPAPVNPWELWTLARDAAGKARNVAGGWATSTTTGTNDLGPGEL